MIVGIDVGGTFTDFVFVEDGRLSVYKRPSTPDDPARGVLEGLAEVASATRGSGFSLIPDEVVHGSTVATNAVIERKGARTALITTRGFRDVLVIGRQTRPRLYDLSPRRPPPLVPDELRLGVSERLDYRGRVLEALDAAEAESLLDRLQAEGVESLAVCLLFSFLNPEHERLLTEAARRRGMAVSASHEVLPEHREYERMSTTVINAYVSPVMGRYLSRLEAGLRERGVKKLRVMASSGGSISPAAAGRLAVHTALSGPAGGVAGAFALASRAGFDRIITLDMGGTSTDVSLCPGRILERDQTSVGDLPVRGPTVDVLSVGAGGGSIARLDEGGALRVGPESAGADPGPACYGRGDQPTVTDVHVVLGRIPPEHFLGGRMAIRTDLAAKAIERIAAPFGGDARRAAAAVLRVANANMERALRVVSVERGHDPRLLTLVAFGGAGPLHACDLAESLRMPRVLVPPHPGVLSAFGMASAPVIKELATAMLPLVVPPGEAAREAERTLIAVFDEMEKRGLAELQDEGFATDGARPERVLDMRYQGQSYELPVPVDDLSPVSFLPRFHALHAERYSHSDASRPVEVVTARLKLVLPPSVILSEAKNLSTRHRGRAGRPGLARGMATRPVWFNGKAIETPVLERSRLAPGHAFDGPALVVQMDSTTVVAPGWHARLDAHENLVLEPAGA